MGVRSRLVALALGGALLTLPLAAGAAPPKPAANVKAEGNPFSGGLRFDPKAVSVKVGQIVRWTNTDDFVPHTATEDHKLWNLTGTYGQPVASGFGPGESRQRRFEAGTQRYYCEVHPEDMRGVVRVPVKLAVKQIPTGRRVVIRWAPATAGTNRVFDVQVKRGSGKWKSFRSGTTKPFGTVDRSGAKIPISVRARLRRKGAKADHTDWSPVASVNA